MLLWIKSKAFYQKKNSCYNNVIVQNFEWGFTYKILYYMNYKFNNNSQYKKFVIKEM